MQYYSVRQFCDMVGVPYSSLRYFERIGLLKPRQDEQNNYRAYTPQDAFLVNRFKFYRSLGFEVKEAMSFIENEDEAYFIERIGEQEENIKKQMLMLQHQLNTLTSIRKNMKYIENEDLYERVYLKNRLFLPASHGNQFSVSTYECFSKWVELLPITTYCKIINKEEFINANKTNENSLMMHYGIAINEENAHLLEAEDKDKVKYLKGGPCLVFYSDEFNHGLNGMSCIERVKLYMENNGLEIDGDIFFEGARVTLNQFGRGNMVYIPIKEKC